MKRVILTESEKSNILSKHNLIFETYGNEQQIMMDFKNKFMEGSYSEIADGLEKIKSTPGVTQDQISELNQAIGYLRKNNFMSETAKSMVDKKFNDYINDQQATAKNMICYLIKQNPNEGNNEIKNLCSEYYDSLKNIQDTFEKKAKETIKTDVKPEIKKVESKPKDTGSFMNPYGSGSNTSPGSFMNPYGS